MAILTPIQEFEFLWTVIAIIFGFQIGTYFFYQYLKLREKRIPLNKILLSYGSLLILMFTTLLLITIIHENYNFFSDLVIAELIQKVAYIIAVCGVILFWYFIRSEQFSDLINLKVTKVLMYILIIPIIFALMFDTRTQQFRVSMGLVLISGLYIAFLQYRIIQTSIGSIKKRFILIFLGEIIMIMSLFFGARIVAEFFQYQNRDLLYIIGMILMFSGSLIFFLSVYNFPPFFETGWKTNLIQLFIINQKNNNCLYSMDFKEFFKRDKHISDSILIDDKDRFFSGGLLGIDAIISEITNTKEEKINKIKQGDSFILLDYGTKPSFITYALLVKDDINSIRYCLNDIKTQFESFYKEILMNLDEIKGNEELLFGSFDIILKNIIK